MKINTKKILKTALSLLAVALFSAQASAQSCAEPAGPVSITNIQSTSLTASWGASPDEAIGIQYRWEIRLASDSNPGTPGEIQEGFTENGLLSTTISSLEFSTEYIFYVAYRCSETPTLNQSTWIASAPFTTLPLQAPFATPATAVTDVSFKANWNISLAADDYLLDVSTNSSFSSYLPGYEDFVTTDLFANISGLTANTIYYYRVRARGDNGSGIVTTDESNIISRKTLGPGTSFYTWQAPGEWFPATGIPDDTKDVIIDYDYTTLIDGSFIGKSLTINEGYTLTISSPTETEPFQYVDLRSKITNLNLNNEGLIVESGGMLNQTFTSVNGNSGGMKVERESSKLFRLDYTMWSSPTSDTGTTQTLLDFSPLTAVSPSIRFYNYNTLTDVFESVSSPGTTTFEPGIGYLIRIANNHPAYVMGASGTSWLGTFEGPINGGLYQVPLDISGNGYNMVGNPFPSLLSLDDFLEDNTNVDGTVYFWRRRNEVNTDNGNTSAYYATYTNAGGVGVPDAQPSDDSSGIAPEPFVQVGQGFIIKAATGLAGSQTVTFNNSQRNKDLPDAPFFKGMSTDKTRFWLNLSSSVQMYNKMLVAYLPTSTNDVDRADGKFMGDSNTALTSLLNNYEYTIQGRAAFTTSDIVPLHLRINSAGSYTINFDHADGIFNTTQTIYLKDNLTNITHDIKAAPYTFATEAGTFANRFEIVYSSPLTVGDVVLDANAIAVVKQNGMIVINSGSVTMSNVKIFDIRGRLIAQKNNVNASETSINAGAENQVLIVQIVSNDGVTVSKKFVN